MLHEIWSQDNKNVTEETIVRCWNKAAILLPTRVDPVLNSDTSSPPPVLGFEKKVSNYLFEELCHLMRQVYVKSRLLDCKIIGYGLSQSFAAEGVTDRQEIKQMARVWIDIEDDPMVIREEVELEIDAMEVTDGTESDEEVEDDEDAVDELVGTEDNATETITFLDADEACQILKRYFSERNIPMEHVYELERLEGLVRAHEMPRSGTLRQITHDP